jgi:hypothetical protein
VSRYNLNTKKTALHVLFCGECVDSRGSHAGSRCEVAQQLGNRPAAAAREPHERGVERAERGHGQHAAEAPVADGLERAAAGLAGTDDALARGRRLQQGPDDVDDAALRLVHRVQAVREVVAAGQREREVGWAIGQRQREMRLVAGKRESALAGGEREREFGQCGATCYGRRRRRHSAIDDCGEAGEGDDRGSCCGAEE